MRRLTGIALLAMIVSAFAMSGSAVAQSTGIDCEDFFNQSLAQRFLDADPSDPQGLDGDGDGTACEEFFGTSGSTTTEPSATVPPSTSTSQSTSATTAATSLPQTGSGSAMVNAVHVATIAAGIAFVLMALAGSIRLAPAKRR